MGMFVNKLPELVNLRDFQVTGTTEAQGGDGLPVVVVAVEVQGARPQQRGAFEFHLQRKRAGGKKGSLMTAMVRRLG